MSVLVSSWVWQHSKAKGSQRLVLLAIADHARDDGGSAYPSVAHLAEKCQMDRVTVLRAVSALEQSGALEVRRVDGQVSVYRVVMTPEPVANRNPLQSATRGDLQPPDRLQSATPPVAIRNPTGCNLQPVTIKNHQEPLSIGQTTPKPKTATKPPKPGSDDDPAWLRFWEIYPKRVAKAHARKAWRAAIKKTDPETIIEAAERYRDDPRRDPEFTAHPSTWLNGERWDDSTVVAGPPRRVNGGSPKW